MLQQFSDLVRLFLFKFCEFISIVFQSQRLTKPIFILVVFVSKVWRHEVKIRYLNCGPSSLSHTLLQYTNLCRECNYFFNCNFKWEGVCVCVRVCACKCVCECVCVRGNDYHVHKPVKVSTDQNSPLLPAFLVVLLLWLWLLLLQYVFIAVQCWRRSYRQSVMFSE